MSSPAIILSINDVAKLNGYFNVQTAADVELYVTLQYYNNLAWENIIVMGPYTQSVLAGDVNFSDFGTFEQQVTSVGIYRWKIHLKFTVLGVDTLEDSYTYFEVVIDSLQQPILSVAETESGTHVRFYISESFALANNKIYIKKLGEEYPDTPNLIITGNDNESYTLGAGSYFAKVVSTFSTLSALGQTDPVRFSITTVIPDEEVIDPPDYKNVSNVRLEAITNPYFGNQFLSYFLKIPQVGYYQDPESKSLRSYNIDRINETIRGVVLPQVTTTMIAIPYFGHQNDYKMGVGDGELGTIAVKLKMDRFMNNYTSFLNWQYLKYDWTFGGKNPSNQMKKQMDLEGLLVAEFLDVEENITRQIGYKVIVDTVPALALGVDTPEEIEFEITLRVTDIDLEFFIMGHPISDRQKILQDIYGQP